MKYPSKYILITDLDDENFACPIPPVSIPDSSVYDLENEDTTKVSMTDVLVERVLQDCVSNKADSYLGQYEIYNEARPDLDFVNPAHKAQCTCSR